MKRLTTRCAGHAVMAWWHEEKYTTQEQIDVLTDRLAYYEDMEEQGRLVVLPCKVGDAVYGAFPRYSRTIIECKVVKIKACQFSDGSIRHFVDVEFYIPDPYFDDGRLMLHGHQAVVSERFGSWDRVFLTHEEAENGR